MDVHTITAIDPADTNCGIVKYEVRTGKILRMCWVNLSADCRGHKRLPGASAGKKTSSREMVQRFLALAEADADLFDSDRIVVEQQLINPRNPAIWSAIRNLCIETSVMSRWCGKAIGVSPGSIRKRYRDLYPRFRKRTYKTRRLQNKHDSVQLARAMMTAPELLRLASITQVVKKDDDILEAFLIAVKFAEDLTGEDLVEKRIGRK